MNKKNKLGKSSLAYALDGGNEEMINLLKSGASKNGNGNGSGDGVEEKIEFELIGTYRRIINSKNKYFNEIVRVFNSDYKDKANEFYCSVVNSGSCTKSKDGTTIILKNIDKSELSNVPIGGFPFLREAFNKTKYEQREKSFSKEKQSQRIENAKTLRRACEKGNEGRVFELLAKGNINLNYANPDKYNGPIHDAVKSGSYNCVKHLLYENDLNINAPQAGRSRKMTPLILAAHKNQLKLIVFVFLVILQNMLESC